jgi:thiol-disulfide isomerase/thioredoxin
MFFGWITPALMGLIVAITSPVGRNLRAVTTIIGTTVLFGLLAYPPFLVSGYGATELGSFRFPLSVAASGLNMLAWYAFAVLYLRLRPSGPGRHHLDGAVALLALSTVPAWALAPAVASDAGPMLQAALISLFLDLFSNGWFVLALLGLAYAQLIPYKSRWTGLSLGLMLVGLPLSPLATQRQLALAPPLKILVILSALAVSIGLLLGIASLWRAAAQRAPFWLLPLSLLGLRAIVGAAFALPGTGMWLEGLGLRVLFLHTFLLGAITLGVVAAAQGTWGSRATTGRWWLALAVGLLCASLVPLSGVWPTAWSGHWILIAALIASFLPVAVVAVMVLSPAVSHTTSARLRLGRLPVRIIIVTALAAAAAAVLLSRYDPSTRAALKLPDLTLERLAGSDLDLADLEGRPVVLNLWATWCGPCRRELPMMADMAAAHRDVAFVFADQREGRDQVESYLTERGLDLEVVLLDTEGRLAEHFRSPGLPTTLFFDAQGQLARAHLGEISIVDLFNALNAPAP